MTHLILRIQFEINQHSNEQLDTPNKSKLRPITRDNTVLKNATESLFFYFSRIRSSFFL